MTKEADPVEETDNKWPAWFYGPDGARDIFEKKADVPKGWVDHPDKVDTKSHDL